MSVPSGRRFFDNQASPPALELVPRDEELRPYWERLTEAQRDVLSHPERYVGIAPAKTLAVCDEWAKRLGLDGA